MEREDQLAAEWQAAGGGLRLDALRMSTARLERRLAQCRSRLMLITSFSATETEV